MPSTMGLLGGNSDLRPILGQGELHPLDCSTSPGIRCDCIHGCGWRNHAKAVSLFYLVRGADGAFVCPVLYPGMSVSSLDLPSFLEPQEGLLAHITTVLQPASYDLSVCEPAP